MWSDCGPAIIYGLMAKPVVFAVLLQGPVLLCSAMTSHAAVHALPYIKASSIAQQ